MVTFWIVGDIPSVFTWLAYEQVHFSKLGIATPKSSTLEMQRLMSERF